MEDGNVKFYQLEVELQSYDINIKEIFSCIDALSYQEQIIEHLREQTERNKRR